MKTKLQKTLYAAVALSLLLASKAVAATAATAQITGGTNGPACNSGGYFTPSSVTINSGDTVTISIPANDPYAGGMEVLGFSQGNFDIARGGSFTTDPITTDVSYHGTWPNDPACQKGSGTITVNAPVSPPPSSLPASGGSSGSTSGSSSGGSTQSMPSTSSSMSSAAQPTTSTTPTTATSATSTTNSSTSKAKSQPKTNHPSSTSAAETAKSPALKNAATFGGGGLAAIAIGLFVVWRLIARRRLRSPGEQPSPVQLAQTEPDPIQPSTPNASDTSTDQNAADPQDENR